jgi:hypothetical protein
MAKAKDKKEDKKERAQKGRNRKDSGSDVLVIGYNNEFSRRSADTDSPSSSPLRQHHSPHSPATENPFRYHGFQGNERSPSQCSTRSEASNTGSSNSWGVSTRTSLRRKPIPVEMFLRSGI